MNESATPSVYPIRLEGELDPPLSRWLWLVKWTGEHEPDTEPIPADVVGPDPAPGLS